MHSDPRGAENRGPGHAAHAAGRGPSASSTPATATDLSAARDALVSSSGRTRRLDTQALRDALVDLFDFWLTTEGSDLGIRPDSGFALVAVGGLGRREMLPHSDLDLILLHDNIDPETVSSVADRLWYRCGTHISGSITASGRSRRLYRWLPVTFPQRSGCSKPDTSPATRN